MKDCDLDIEEQPRFCKWLLSGGPHPYRITANRFDLVQGIVDREEWEEHQIEDTLEVSSQNDQI